MNRTQLRACHTLVESDLHGDDVVSIQEISGNTVVVRARLLWPHTLHRYAFLYLVGSDGNVQRVRPPAGESPIRILSNQEAVSRIREGRHADFAHDQPIVNAVLIEEIERGNIVVGFNDETQILHFTRVDEGR